MLAIFKCEVDWAERKGGSSRRSGVKSPVIQMCLYPSASVGSVCVCTGVHLGEVV